MDKKNLIQEISRIKEVMGLINENARTSAVKGLINIIDDLLGITTKNTDELIREFGDEGATLLRELTNEGDNVRGLGDILDDLKKLENPKAFDDASAALRQALEEPDDAGITIMSKIDNLKREIQNLLDEGQNSSAAKYFDSEIDKIAEFGDDTLKRFIKDEYFFNSIPNFSRENYNDYLKLSDDISIGPVTKFIDTLASYFRKIENVEARIKDDINSYLDLKNEVNKLQIDNPNRTEMIKRANRYLDRVEFNLGVINRKNKETLDALIEDLTQRRNSLPTTSAERDKFNKLIERASKEDADVISIWNYLPEGGYKPEGSWYEEMKQLKQERTDALRKVLFNPKGIPFTKSGTVERVAKLSYMGSLWRVASGNVVPVLKKLFSDPKKAPRILATEIGSRLISIPIMLAIVETIIDGAMFILLKDSVFVNEEWIKEHPNWAKLIASFGFDYKDYEDSYWMTDIVINIAEKTLQNFGITIPFWSIKKWMDEYFYAGGGYDWLNQQVNKINEIQKSEQFKNASEEEKLKIIEDIIIETDTWVTKAASWWYNGFSPTIESQINKVLAQIESETTPTPTPDNNTPNTGEVTAQQLQQLEYVAGNVESIGNGRYKDVDGYLYKFEDNKWKVSIDEGQTWIDLSN